MAKRKAARATGRKAASKRSGASGGRAGARKTASRSSAARKKTAGRTGTARRAGAAKKSAARTRAKAALRTGRSGAAASRKKTAAKSALRKPGRRVAAKKASAGTGRSAPRRATAPKTIPARKAPNLDRARRTIVSEEDDLVPTPPSSLDLDRSASAIRSGRKGLRDRYSEHTETSPALTGGDVDADWESAYSVGDEAPGGDNPTPDQDIVDDIGRAVGVEYQDNEELKGADKLTKRDRNRWELDPASSEDWDDR
jgi:hypothetical protein